MDCTELTATRFASSRRRRHCIRRAAAFASVVALTLTTARSEVPTPVDAGAARPPSAAELIETLGLEGHVEGGFYRRTYEATDTPRIDAGQGERFSMTSIYYLLTSEGPVGHFHRNRSDIVHYFHLGDPIEYFLLHPDGRLERRVMGPDPTRGQQLQLTVPGGIWKASRLRPGTHGYGLISEAVTPGFDYADMSLGDRSGLQRRFPEHAELIAELTRRESPAGAR